VPGRQAFDKAQKPWKLRKQKIESHRANVDKKTASVQALKAQADLAAADSGKLLQQAAKVSAQRPGTPYSRPLLSAFYPAPAPLHLLFSSLAHLPLPPYRCLLASAPSLLSLHYCPCILASASLLLPP